MIEHLGDSGGHGHDLSLVLQDDGTVVLMSRNPDTDERQRIVLLEMQWRLLLRSLMERYGREKCCFLRAEGLCGPVARDIEITC